jgi:hypothetical protein
LQSNPIYERCSETSGRYQKEMALLEAKKQNSQDQLSLRLLVLEEEHGLPRPSGFMAALGRGYEPRRT